MVRRRGNGEGSITRRKDGRWEARYIAHTARGPKRKVIYGKTRKEVADKLARALADRASGLVFDDESMTVGEYLDRWLEDSDRGSVRASTHERHTEIVGLHVRPALGRLKLSKLSPAHVQGLYRDKLDSGLSRPPSRRSTRCSTRRSRTHSGGTWSRATSPTRSRPRGPRQKRCARSRRRRRASCLRPRAATGWK